MEPVSPGRLYEILKIWVPTHGTINVYRSPQGDYHVDNGFLLEEPRKQHGFEKIRILASHGSVIVITRDKRLPLDQNKYTSEPTMAIDASAMRVEDNW